MSVRECVCIQNQHRLKNLLSATYTTEENHNRIATFPATVPGFKRIDARVASYPMDLHLCLRSSYIKRPTPY